jgi:hypothetical protein
MTCSPKNDVGSCLQWNTLGCWGIIHGCCGSWLSHRVIWYLSQNIVCFRSRSCSIIHRQESTSSVQPSGWRACTRWQWYVYRPSWCIIRNACIRDVFTWRIIRWTLLSDCAGPYAVSFVSHDSLFILYALRYLRWMILLIYAAVNSSAWVATFGKPTPVLFNHQTCIPSQDPYTKCVSRLQLPPFYLTQPRDIGFTEGGRGML